MFGEAAKAFLPRRHRTKEKRLYDQYNLRPKEPGEADEFDESVDEAIDEAGQRYAVFSLAAVAHGLQPCLSCLAIFALCGRPATSSRTRFVSATTGPARRNQDKHMIKFQMAVVRRRQHTHARPLLAIAKASCPTQHGTFQ